MSVILNPNRKYKKENKNTSKVIPIKAIILLRFVIFLYIKNIINANKIRKPAVEKVVIIVKIKIKFFINRPLHMSALLLK